MPELKSRKPFNTALKTTSLLKHLGAVLDIAPVNHSSESLWMTLADNGDVFSFNADTEHYAQVARSSVPAEPKDTGWRTTLRQRLHVSNRGDFVAVVNDYGRYGQIIDVRTRKVTLNLDGGDYQQQTVPLSFAFAESSKGVIAIHRTAWNRLEMLSQLRTRQNRGQAQCRRSSTATAKSEFIQPTKLPITAWKFH